MNFTAVSCKKSAYSFFASCEPLKESSSYFINYHDTFLVLLVLNIQNTQSSARIKVYTYISLKKKFKSLFTAKNILSF